MFAHLPLCEQGTSLAARDGYQVLIPVPRGHGGDTGRGRGGEGEGGGVINIIIIKKSNTFFKMHS